MIHCNKSVEWKGESALADRKKIQLASLGTLLLICTNGPLGSAMWEGQLLSMKCAVAYCIDKSLQWFIDMGCLPVTDQTDHLPGINPSVPLNSIVWAFSWFIEVIAIEHNCLESVPGKCYILQITAFIRLNAAAFINFRTYFGAAFIQGRRLIE